MEKPVNSQDSAIFIHQNYAAKALVIIPLNCGIKLKYEQNTAKLSQKWSDTVVEFKKANKNEKLDFEFTEF